MGRVLCGSRGTLCERVLGLSGVGVTRPFVRQSRLSLDAVEVDVAGERVVGEGEGGEDEGDGDGGEEVVLGEVLVVVGVPVG